MIEESIHQLTVGKCVFKYNTFAMKKKTPILEHNSWSAAMETSHYLCHDVEETVIAILVDSKIAKDPLGEIGQTREISACLRLGHVISSDFCFGSMEMEEPSGLYIYIYIYIYIKSLTLSSNEPRWTLQFHISLPKWH